MLNAIDWADIGPRVFLCALVFGPIIFWLFSSILLATGRAITPKSRRNP